MRKNIHIYLDSILKMGIFATSFTKTFCKDRKNKRNLQIKTKKS